MNRVSNVTPVKSELGLTLEEVEYYSTNPVAFIEDVIFTGPIKETYQNLFLSESQKEIAQAVSDYEMVAVRSGRGEGKTAILSLIILWFLATRYEPRVICTGPKFEQLKKTLWIEISKWLYGSSIAHLFNWTAESLNHVFKPSLWFATLMTASVKENIAGQHSYSMLFIVDEASGVDRTIIQHLIGSMTQADNKILMVGNPTQITGVFFDAFHSEKDFWKCLHYNSENSPHVMKKWLEMMQRKYGKDHDIYRVNVLGEFPKGNPQAFIQLADVEAAAMRTVEPKGALEMGADCARYGGDLTVVTIRQGNHVFPQEILPKASHPENARFIIDVLRKYRLKTGYKDRVRIKIDDTGASGGISDILNEFPDYANDNIEVVPVVFSNKQFEHHADVVSYMWQQLKDVIMDIELPNDPDRFLIEELASRKYETNTGKIKLESKAKFKETIGDSPDRSDSLVLCFAGDTGYKRVSAGFDQRKEKHVSDFQIDWGRTRNTGMNYNSLHYGAFCQSNEMNWYGLCGLWDDLTSQLYVYDEIEFDYAIPMEIANEVKNRMRLNEYNVEKLVVPEELFDPKTPKCLPRLINKEMETLVHTPIEGLAPRMRPCYRFNMQGATSMAIQMFYKDRIMFHSKCYKAIGQVRSWQIEKGHVTTDGNEFCFCLLMMLCELSKRDPTIIKRIMSPDYENKGKSLLIGKTVDSRIGIQNGTVAV